MASVTDITTTTEPSPAGALREHPVPCVVCSTPTFNHSARCDTHRKRCASCGVKIPFGNWCSARCHRDDEGPDRGDDE